MKMMRASRVFTAAAMAVWISAPHEVRAAEPGPDALPITVLSIKTLDADDQAEALTKALRNGVRGLPGWSLKDDDFSFEVLTLRLKCAEPPDAECQKRLADAMTVDRFIWGVLKKKKNDESTVVGEVNFWVRGRGTSKTELIYSA